jgi:hypothetical protein
MPFVINLAPKQPNANDPTAVFGWFMSWAEAMLKALRGLVYLDFGVREVRSLHAESANVFVSAIVVSTGVTRLRDEFPIVQDKVFTTALIMFDAGSGAGRFRLDGQDPIPATATAAAGMPVLAAGGSLVITGQQNIARFAITAEGATALNMSITLYQ